MLAEDCLLFATRRRETKFVHRPSAPGLTFATAVPPHYSTGLDTLSRDYDGPIDFENISWPRTRLEQLTNSIHRHLHQILFATGSNFVHSWTVNDLYISIIFL